MPEFQATSGPVNVVTSGTVIAFKGNPIEISFSALPAQVLAVPPLNVAPAGTMTFPFVHPSFKLIFRFVDEVPQPGAPPLSARFEAKPTPGELTMEITLYNFTAPLGLASPEPVNFGFSAGRKLYLNYVVYSVGSGYKTLHFTIYQDKEPNPEVLKATAAPTEPKKEANG